MRLFVLLFSLLLAGQQALAQIRPYDDIVASGVLKVAVYQDFPPYSYKQDGQPRGVDVAVAGALAEGLGLKLELLWMEPGEKLDDDLRNYIWKGHYLRPNEHADLMMRVPYDRDFTFKRNELGELINERVAMFGPYQRECWQVVYDTRRLKDVPSIAVFQYHPIGVELESVPSFYLSSVMGGRLSSHTQHFRTPSEAFAAMRAAKVDAVMGLRGELDWLLSHSGDAKLKAAENAYPDMGRQVWDIGMAVHESNRQLAYAVEEVLEGLILDGKVKKLYEAEGLRYELPGLYQDVQ
ncbi:substrate-binding periplasmic protein [Pseudomonas indica]|uniref:substrate-binding periplasmic protein n=1 Tax=Pseudomonas indica TaxID=137658 RepID=UPI003FCF44AF